MKADCKVPQRLADRDVSLKAAKSKILSNRRKQDFMQLLEASMTQDYDLAMARREGAELHLALQMMGLLPGDGASHRSWSAVTIANSLDSLHWERFASSTFSTILMCLIFVAKLRARLSHSALLPGLTI